MLDSSTVPESDKNAIALVKILPRSHRDLGEISPKISPRFWPPRFSSRRDLVRSRPRSRY